jgi:AAA+ superfamily predicted ATPase
MGRSRKQTTADIGEHQGETSLYAALAQFDQFLAEAIDKAEKAFGPQAALDGLRGLHLAPADIQRDLAQAPGEPTLSTSAAALFASLRQDEKFAWLIESYGLTEAEVAILLIALAPEIDLRYERLYAYLQDDVSRRKPTVDLVLNLLATSRTERWSLSTLFAPDATLRSRYLLELGGDREIPLLARTLNLDPQISWLLLEQSGLDPRLQSWCQLYRPGVDLDGLPVGVELRRSLRAVVERKVDGAASVRLHFRGPHGIGKRLAAEALATAWQAPILMADLRRARESTHGFDAAVRILVREAWLRDALLFLHGFDALVEAGEHQVLRWLATTLAGAAVSVVVAGTAPWPPLASVPLGFRTLTFGYPDATTRRNLWYGMLEAYGMSGADELAQALAPRFKLTPVQIAEAVALAQAELDVVWDPEDNGERLSAAARAQCGHELTRLATRIEPRAGWNDLVLPHDALEQLREICARVATRDLVRIDWGCGSVHSRSPAVTALFAGPSGTGKTLAAEALAYELGLGLYRIDLAGVVSKYIGETEKNLDRVFAAAENANAVLFFDEADALFGKRSEVKDAHDRYANIEIAYLLQKMEQFDGLAILATNLKQNLDEAFVRRLTFTVNFPFPEEAERLRLWETLWPPRAPRAEDVDLAWFAREFRLSGGNIRNTVLAAAHLAAADGQIVTCEHLLHATRREYQKLGKNLVPPAGGRLP